MHSSLAGTRGGKDQVPILTGWRRELSPAVLVVPVVEVEKFLQQQRMKPKDQKAPARHVLQSISSTARSRLQLLPSSADASPAAAFFQKYRAPLHPRALRTSSHQAPAQRGASLWQPAKASPVGEHNQNCSKGCLDAKGCWSQRGRMAVAGEGDSCFRLSRLKANRGPPSQYC